MRVSLFSLLNFSVQMIHLLCRIIILASYAEIFGVKNHGPPLFHTSSTELGRHVRTNSRKSQEHIPQLLKVGRPQSRDRVPPRRRIEATRPTSGVISNGDVVKRVRVAIEGWV